MDSHDAARIFKAIRRIVRAIDLRSREVSRATGLTIPQVVVLQGIADLGEVTTKALSDHADLSSATVVTILDKLEDKRLIERYRSKEDRRVVHARLTGEGESAVQALPWLLHEEFQKKFAARDPETQAMLIAAIAEIADMMDARNLDAAPILTTDDVPQ
ncbi:DNA-binding MarR family transcriptional regulator [Roseibium hamelinense]|uniref:DNA-binding MarR family transcriptional regulator n=1 Tax=Roseibium hamelinense TaxID=150831 RepID=A0A562TGV9_9HYPH|nr:MarR family transcriptional regulator [Roseibium hamelinense]MTI45948.1 MarR family transcriptional regulator [Roseibium hamelinense]TWI92867.1 DNA-binding MarR family transcriptional regulator [Roseibium hamelinense]